MYPGWIFWQSDRDVQVPNRGLLYPWQVCKGIQRLLFCLACNQAFYLLLRCVRRGTIEKIEKDQPVRAVLAARTCNALSRHLPNPITYESLGIKVL